MAVVPGAAGRSVCLMGLVVGWNEQGFVHEAHYALVYVVMLQLRQHVLMEVLTIWALEITEFQDRDRRLGAAKTGLPGFYQCCVQLAGCARESGLLFDRAALLALNREGAAAAQGQATEHEP